MSIQNQPDIAPVKPGWWTTQHGASWEGVKEAFRRDWEQTKADVSSTGGQNLNQTAGDTLRQTLGSDAIPPSGAKTRPTAPKDAVRDVVDAFSNMEAEAAKAGVTIANAEAGIAQETARLDKKVERAQHDLAMHRVDAGVRAAEATVKADQRIARVESSMADEYVHLSGELGDVQAELDARRQSTNDRLAKAQESSDAIIQRERQNISEAAARRDEAMATWRTLEREACYGFSARRQFEVGTVWDDALESRLRLDWDEVGTATSWDAAKEGVRLGWNFVGKSKQ